MTFKRCSCFLVGAFLLAMAGGLMAQTSDLTVGEIEISSLRWGPQTAVFDVTNKSDYTKTFAVSTEIIFDGTYMDPRRINRVNYNLPAGETKKVSQDIYIPGNYGTATMTLGVYDIVDTLDPLLDYQRVMEQPWTLRYNVPDGMLDYLQEEVTLPPMVSNNEDFDSEFIRIFMLLMAEGKSYEEIAEMAGCDLSFVKHAAKMLQEQQYIRMGEGGKPILTFPVIMAAEATEARELAEKVSDDLAAFVERNIPTHRENLKTLANQKIIPPNEDDFMHGGAALYYTYPTVTALLFWYHMGNMFIDPEHSLNIYENTDYCRAHIPRYMYAVQGGPYFNGTVFYAAELNRERPIITFMDSIPNVWCIDNFEKFPYLYPGIHWNWVDSIAPEPFVLDTLIVEKGMKGIGKDSEQFVQEAKAEFKAVQDKYGHKQFLPGARYWFWNLVTTRATLKLIDKGVIVRRSDGFFTYENL